MHAGSLAQTPEQIAFPSGITGIAARWDPSDVTTITFATPPNMTGLLDKSANVRNLTQGTGAQRPDNARTINGLAAVNYDGGDSLGPASAWTLAQPLTYFAVAASELASGTQTVIDKNTSGTAGPLLLRNASDQWEMNGGTALVGPTADLLPHVFTCVFNGASSRFRIDGAEYGGNAGAQSFSAGGACLGRTRSGTNWWTGLIAEVIIYAGALSTPDITSMEAYLRRKWFDQ